MHRKAPDQRMNTFIIEWFLQSSIEIEQKNCLSAFAVPVLQCHCEKSFPEEPGSPHFIKQLAEYIQHLLDNLAIFL